VPLLSAPVADRTNWTLARLAGEIARREDVMISRSHLSKVLRRKGGSATGVRATR
jgi:transposase